VHIQYIHVYSIYSTGPQVHSWQIHALHMYIEWGCQPPNPREIHCFKWELCV